MMTEQYTLYGGEASYFSGKVRAYLIHKRIPFHEFVATFRLLWQVVIPRTGLHMVPVVITPEDEALQDSTDIIDALELRFPTDSVYPQSPKQHLAALLFEVFADEWLLYPGMHYRWSFPENWGYIVQEFGKIVAPNMPKWFQSIGSLPLAAYFGLLHRPVLGINFRMHKQIEEMTRELFECLNDHFNRYDYLLGARPCIGDYGLVGPLYAHLYRDPAPGKLMRRTAPNLVKWVERMMQPHPVGAGFLAGDQVPETIWPVLKRMFAEHVPAVQDTIQKTHSWVSRNPGKQVPRFIGIQKFSIGGTSSYRAVAPYHQWMFQRPLDYYQSLSSQDKESVDGFLVEIGGWDGMQTKPLTRLVKKNKKIFAE